MRLRSMLTAVVSALPLAAAAGEAPTSAGPAQLFLPGVVSSAYSEIRAAISPDGRTVLWGSTNRPDGPGGWDVWRTVRRGRRWSEPEPVAFDTEHNEFDPAFDADGRYVYFFSNRPGGLGGDDIYRAPVLRGGRFGPAEPLGDAVNTPGDEWAPTPLADGGLLFATDGRGGEGGHDLFVSPRAGGAPGPAVPLPGEVNGPGDDFDAVVIEGGIVFARSDDVETAPIALWYARRGPDGAYGAPVPLGDEVNVPDGFVLGPSADPTRPGALLFSGQRPENSEGRADIYVIELRRPAP